MIENPLINISDAAKDQIETLLFKNQKPGIRISLVGGGCSGFMPKFDYSEAQEKDNIIQWDGGIIFIDQRTSHFIKGATLDYKNSLNDSGFRLENIPGSKRTCGCGSSFSF